MKDNSNHATADETPRPTTTPETFLADQLLKAIGKNDAEATEYYALAYLLSRPLYSGEFAWVMNIVFDLGKMSPAWKAAFETAYENQPANRRILYRDSMTKLHLWFKDYHMAAEFLAVKPELPQELAEAMEIYLQEKRYDDALTIAETCGQKMVCYDDPGSLRILLKTLRRYHRAMKEQDNRRWELPDLIDSLEERWQSRTASAQRETTEGIDNLDGATK